MRGLLRRGSAGVGGAFAALAAIITTPLAATAAPTCPVQPYDGPVRAPIALADTLTPNDCVRLLGEDGVLSLTRLAHGEATLTCVRAGDGQAAGRIDPLPDPGAAVAFTNAGAPVGGFVVHEVQPGESLSRLAEIHLGDRNRYDVVFAVNRSVTCSHWVYPGDRLIVPLPADRISALMEAGDVEVRPLPSREPPTPPDPTPPDDAPADESVDDTPSRDTASPASIAAIDTGSDTGSDTAGETVDHAGDAPTAGAPATRLTLTDERLSVDGEPPAGAASAALLINGRSIPPAVAALDAGAVNAETPISVLGPGVNHLTLAAGREDGAMAVLARETVVMPPRGRDTGDCAPLAHAWGPDPSRRLGAGDDAVMATGLAITDGCAIDLTGRGPAGAAFTLTPCAGPNQAITIGADGRWSAALTPDQPNAGGLVTPFTATCPTVTAPGAEPSLLSPPNDVRTIASLLASAAFSVDDEDPAAGADDTVSVTSTLALDPVDAAEAQAVLLRLNPNAARGGGADALGYCLALAQAGDGVITRGGGCAGGARVRQTDAGFTFTQDIARTDAAAREVALTSTVAMVASGAIGGAEPTPLVAFPIAQADTVLRTAAPTAAATATPSGSAPEMTAPADGSGGGGAWLGWTAAALILFAVSFAGLLGDLMAHMARGVWLLASAPFVWLFGLGRRLMGAS